jgi:hypothetical protein
MDPHSEMVVWKDDVRFSHNIKELSEIKPLINMYRAQSNDAAHEYKYSIYFHCNDTDFNAEYNGPSDIKAHVMYYGNRGTPAISADLSYEKSEGALQINKLSVSFGVLSRIKRYRCSKTEIVEYMDQVLAGFRNIYAIAPVIIGKNLKPEYEVAYEPIIGLDESQPEYEKMCLCKFRTYKRFIKRTIANFGILAKP